MPLFFLFAGRLALVLLAFAARTPRALPPPRPAHHVHKIALLAGVGDVPGLQRPHHLRGRHPRDEVQSERGHAAHAVDFERGHDALAREGRVRRDGAGFDRKELVVGIGAVFDQVPGEHGVRQHAHAGLVPTLDRARREGQAGGRPEHDHVDEIPEADRQGDKK